LKDSQTLIAKREKEDEMKKSNVVMALLGVFGLVIIVGVWTFPSLFGLEELAQEEKIFVVNLGEVETVAAESTVPLGPAITPQEFMNWPSTKGEVHIGGCSCAGISHTHFMYEKDGVEVDARFIINGRTQEILTEKYHQGIYRYEYFDDIAEKTRVFDFNPGAGFVER